MTPEQIASLRAARERAMSPAQVALSRLSTRLQEAGKISATKAAEADMAHSRATEAEVSAKSPGRNYTDRELEEMIRGYGFYSGGVASSAQLSAAKSAYQASSGRWPSASFFKERLAQADREAAEMRAVMAKKNAIEGAQAAATAAAEEKAIRAEYEALAEVERRRWAEEDAAEKKRLMELAIEREAKKRVEEAEFEAAVQAKMAAMRVTTQ
jgi:hypothetical protein